MEDYHNYPNFDSTGAVVLIAETNSCQLSLESRPFLDEARKPRETELFTFKWRKDEHGYLWKRIYMGSYERSTNAIEKKRNQASSLTDRVPPPTLDAIPTISSIPHQKRPRLN